MKVGKDRKPHDVGCSNYDESTKISINMTRTSVDESAVHERNLAGSKGWERRGLSHNQATPVLRFGLCRGLSLDLCETQLEDFGYRIYELTSDEVWGASKKVTHQH
jgi:hypothetical protein